MPGSTYNKSIVISSTGRATATTASAFTVAADEYAEVTIYASSGSTTISEGGNAFGLTSSGPTSFIVGPGTYDVTISVSGTASWVIKANAP